MAIRHRQITMASIRCFQIRIVSTACPCDITGGKLSIVTGALGVTDTIPQTMRSQVVRSRRRCGTGASTPFLPKFGGGLAAALNPDFFPFHRNSPRRLNSRSDPRFATLSEMEGLPGSG